MQMNTYISEYNECESPPLDFPEFSSETIFFDDHESLLFVMPFLLCFFRLS